MGRERRAVWASAVVLVLLTLSYGAVIRLGFGPDEPRHYRYLPLLVEQHQLPRVLPDGRELGDAIALHPPLYYSLVAPCYLLGKAVGGAWLAQRLMRLAAPLFGLATLLLWNAAFGHVFAGRRGLALLATALVGLWPHWLMDHSLINNDNGANLAGAAVVWFLVSRPPGPWSRRDAALGGLLLGLASLMKAQLLLCLPPTLLLLLAWDHGRRCWRDRSFWTNLVLVLGVQVVVCGWWYGRNLLLYGSINYVAPGYGGIPHGMSLGQAWSEGLLSRLVLRAVAGEFHSIWVQVGWVPQQAESLVYGLLGVLLALSLLGWAVGYAGARRAGWQPAPRQVRDAAAIVLPFAFIYVLLLGVSTFVHIGVYQGGRYALFALGGFVTLLVWGWSLLLSGAPALVRWRPWLAGLLLAGFLVLNLLCLWNLATVLNPTYAPGVTFWTPISGT